MATNTRAHWETVYREKEPDRVSWFEDSPAASLELIESLGLAPDDGIVDVGGGASRLAAELLHRGYADITVADISDEALSRARAELGDDAERIDWREADVRDHDFGRRFALWHDRAAFHFMVTPQDRNGYVATLARSIAPAGDVIVATFGPQGPTSCSGLPVARYGPDELADALGGGYAVRSSRLVDHVTPSGAHQQFMYAHLSAPG